MLVVKSPIVTDLHDAILGKLVVIKDNYKLIKQILNSSTDKSSLFYSPAFDEAQLLDCSNELNDPPPYYSNEFNESSVHSAAFFGDSISACL